MTTNNHKPTVICEKCKEEVPRNKASVAFKGGVPFPVCLECLDEIMEDYRKKYGEL